MSSDSDPILTKKPDDMMTMVAELIADIPFKLIALIFIIFIILNSSAFIDRILSKFSGAVEGHDVKSWGTILQGIFLVLSTIVVDSLIKNKIF